MHKEGSLDQTQENVSGGADIDPFVTCTLLVPQLPLILSILRVKHVLHGI